MHFIKINQLNICKVFVHRLIRRVMNRFYFAFHLSYNSSIIVFGNFARVDRISVLDTILNVLPFSRKLCHLARESFSLKNKIAQALEIVFFISQLKPSTANTSDFFLLSCLNILVSCLSNLVCHVFCTLFCTFLPCHVIIRILTEPCCGGIHFFRNGFSLPLHPKFWVYEINLDNFSKDEENTGIGRDVVLQKDTGDSME